MCGRRRHYARSQNSDVGIELDGASFSSSPAVSVTGCDIGIRADVESHLDVNNLSVTGNGIGLLLDGPTAQIRNATITGNTTREVQLSFGARASFNGTNTVGTVQCESNVIVRGNVSCPLSALSPARMSARVGPRMEPFVMEK